jgi:formylglycine-generating enzyme required for sulfatase activity
LSLFACGADDPSDLRGPNDHLGSPGSPPESDQAPSATPDERNQPLRVTAGALPSVYVIRGHFFMGCAAAHDPDCRPDESPGRIVTLSRSFEIDRTEVTQRQWLDCMKAGACSEPAAHFYPHATPNDPVRNVNWFQAADYCAWQGKQLPTEAQWEKAARGIDGRIFPWGDHQPDCAWAVSAVCGSGPHSEIDTASEGASPCGAADMAGNVFEWVSDYYASDAYATGAAFDPRGPATGSERVVRGGSYASSPTDLRVSSRQAAEPKQDYDTVGVRCVRELAPGL